MKALARIGEAKRKTQEVEISVKVDLDGKGDFEGSSGSKFIDHMLKTLAKHSRIDVKADAQGDLKHHIIEDLALTLGKAIGVTLGNRTGICRFGSAYAPMDDSLARAVIDLGGRPFSRIRLGIKEGTIEDTKVEDLNHFLESLAQALGCNIHIKVLYGSNDHHRAEAAVKALALALKTAVSRSGIDDVPSAKGEIV